MNRTTNFINKPSFSLCFRYPFSCSATQPVQPVYDLSTCIASLQACARYKSLRKGKQIHAYMLTNGFLCSPLSITSLINMYSKCNQMGDAVSTFYYRFHDHNVFAYNAVIAGFTANGLARNAFEFYNRMRLTYVVPDKFTFPCVIRACCSIREVMKIHSLVIKLGLELDVYVGSALVNTYLKFLLVKEAQKVFEELPSRDIVLWNAMVNGFAQIGRFDEALVVFRTMGEEGVMPSRFTVTGVLSIFAMMGDFDHGRAIHAIALKMGYDSHFEVANALIDMYGKCKFTEDALDIFDMMIEKDIYSWNSIIAVHEQCGYHDETLRLFYRMLGAGILPDLVTITIVVPACSHLSALMHGREIHGYMIKNGVGKGDVNKEDVNDVLMANAIMDMYAKCGSMRNAYMVFDKMKNKDIASWNIMITGYGMHGNANEALDMFSRMCETQIEVDEVTLVGVLSACSHAGLVSEGRELLRQMRSKYGVIPTIEHYTCVVDMLGRAGHVVEAFELVQNMPIQANAVVWRALLAACRLHRNSDIAKVAAQKLMEIDPGHSGNYVLTSNIFVDTGQYEEVSEVRQTMRQHNVQKAPGCSWTELKDGMHAFVNGDRSHPKANFIYAQLDSLTARLREHGYVPQL
ncbi:PREDICTED: pentatricopeptide repeat-containing protein At3g14730-like [Fragaria vesca subsp. vesca]|uniref:pentatricopeptide repeat-containing protein At3g14730 n=1 Tax=Fragaria vesca subsp. vesca TaxID=101020 RepID=UPI0002C362B8|nr:PREDICTED: pentatricopeptide repeat-containing protein At3g14730 [Fragaria vesca subsp. vesca]